MKPDYPDVSSTVSSPAFIDFPGGWRYGFPRQLDRDNDKQSMVDWLISKSVPEWLAVQEQNHLRIWSVPENASTIDFPPLNEKR